MNVFFKAFSTVLLATCSVSASFAQEISARAGVADKEKSENLSTTKAGQLRKFYLYRPFFSGTITGPP